MLDASTTGWVIEVGDEGFETEIIERSKQVPVVIDFWAEWCGPCRTIGPLLEGLARAKAGAFVLAKINVEEAQQLAGAFRIEGIPAIRVIKDGQLVNGFDGLLPEDQLKDFIDQICPSDAENEFKQVVANEAAQPAEAEAFYRKLLAADVENQQARVGLARVLVQQRKDEEASAQLGQLGVVGDVGVEAERLRRIIDVRKEGGASGDEAPLRKKIEAEPGNAHHRLELGSLLAKQERYQEAMDLLLTAGELDSTLAKNEVRELMVKIWEIIGVRSEMADAYRDKLRALLY